MLGKVDGREVCYPNVRVSCECLQGVFKAVEEVRDIAGCKYVCVILSTSHDTARSVVHFDVEIMAGSVGVEVHCREIPTRTNSRQWWFQREHGRQKRIRLVDLVGQQLSFDQIEWDIIMSHHFHELCPDASLQLAQCRVTGCVNMERDAILKQPHKFLGFRTLPLTWGHRADNELGRLREAIEKGGKTSHQCHE